MEFTLILIICCIVAYLMGSIPTSIWIGKGYYGIDVREHGSQNPGASNTFRVLGRKTGIVVLLIDTLKGFLAVMLIYWFSGGYEGNLIPWQLLCGLLAVLGHLFPVFANFSGGKGVATLLGVVLALHPLSALAALALFLILLVATRQVAVGSIGGALLYPSILYWGFNWQEPFLLTFALLMAALVIVTHRSNIKRLVKGEENKVNLFN